MHERGVRDRPAGTEIADHRVARNDGVSQEHLVEHGVAGHLSQRTNLDARLVHVDHEPGDALVFRGVGVGAGGQHPEIGLVPHGGPHLLPVDDPLVAVALGPTRQPREVRTGAGFGEQLAPCPLTGDDVAHERVDLRLGAVRGDRRRSEEQPQPGGSPHGAVFGDRLLHTNDVVAAETTSVGVRRKAGSRPAVDAEPLPPLRDGEVGVPVFSQPIAKLIEHIDRLRRACFVRHGNLPWVTARRSYLTARR